MAKSCTISLPDRSRNRNGHVFCLDARSSTTTSANLFFVMFCCFDKGGIGFGRIVLKHRDEQLTISLAETGGLLLVQDLAGCLDQRRGGEIANRLSSLRGGVLDCFLQLTGQAKIQSASLLAAGIMGSPMDMHSESKHHCTSYCCTCHVCSIFSVLLPDSAPQHKYAGF